MRTVSQTRRNSGNMSPIMALLKLETETLCISQIKITCEVNWILRCQKIDKNECVQLYSTHAQRISVSLRGTSSLCSRDYRNTESQTCHSHRESDAFQVLQKTLSSSVFLSCSAVYISKQCKRCGM